MSHEHKVVPGLISESDLCRIREAVCIQVEKIYDSCKEKNCVEDAKVIFRNPRLAQRVVNRAITVKCRSAKVKNVFTDVEPVPFKQGFYTVDIKFFIKVMMEFLVPKCGGGHKLITIPGAVIYDKKIILFGSEGNVKIFKSKYVEGAMDKPICAALQQDNLPIAKVEVADPIILNSRIMEICECDCDCICCCDDLPDCIFEWLQECDCVLDEVEEESEERQIRVRKEAVVSLGIFSIVKLARYVQLLIPAFDFCVPNKVCISSTDDNPCELFETIQFPVDEFFPPQKFDFPGAQETEARLLE